MSDEGADEVDGSSETQDGEGDGDGDTEDDADPEPMMVPTTTLEPGTAPDCTFTPGDHSAICAEGSPCPVFADVEIRCAEAYFWHPSTVAVDSERAYAAASSDEGAWIFEVQGEAGAARVLPDLFDGSRLSMASEPDGAPRILAVTADKDVAYLTPVDGSFVVETIKSTSGENQTILSNIELDAEGAAHVWWHHNYYAYHAVRVGEATWAIDKIEHEHGYGLDRHNQAVTLIDTGNWPIHRLAARIGDTQYELGSEFTIGQILDASVVRPAHPASVGSSESPDFAAVYLREGLHVAWPDGIGAWTDVLVPDSPYNQNPCEALECGCPDICVDDQGGVLESNFAAAQTSDGAIWVAWVVRHDYREHETEEHETERDCYCDADNQPVVNESTASLHLARIDPTTATVEPKLSVPVEISVLDMRTQGQRMALSLSRLDSNGDILRVLGFDLDAL